MSSRRSRTRSEEQDDLEFFVKKVKVLKVLISGRRIKWILGKAEAIPETRMRS